MMGTSVCIHYCMYSVSFINVRKGICFQSEIWINNSSVQVFYVFGSFSVLIQEVKKVNKFLLWEHNPLKIIAVICDGTESVA